jgi:hypothetical protein
MLLIAFFANRMIVGYSIFSYKNGVWLFMPCENRCTFINIAINVDYDAKVGLNSVTDKF